MQRGAFASRSCWARPDSATGSGGRSRSRRGRTAGRRSRSAITARSGRRSRSPSSSATSPLTCARHRGSHIRPGRAPRDQDRQSSFRAVSGGGQAIQAQRGHAGHHTDLLLRLLLGGQASAQEEVDQGHRSPGYRGNSCQDCSRMEKAIVVPFEIDDPCKASRGHQFYCS